MSINVEKDVPSLSCQDAHGVEIYCFQGKIQYNMKDVMMYLEHHLTDLKLCLKTCVSNDVDLQSR